MTTRDPWLTASELAVWRAWVRLQMPLAAALNRQLAASSSLSLSDYEVLVHLSESDCGSTRVSDLAAALDWERSRLSHHLRRMQERGLIERRDCPNDGRVAYVLLTPHGRETIEQAAPGHAEAVRQLVFTGTDDVELAAVQRFFDRVLTRVGQD